MSQRPYVSFQEIKEKISLPDCFEPLGISPDHFKRKGGKLSGVCPIPSHPHGPCPNPQQWKADNKKGTWMWNCFGCENGGDVIELVKRVEFDGDTEANAHCRFWFAEHFGDVLSLDKPRKEQDDEPGSG